MSIDSRDEWLLVCAAKIHSEMEHNLKKVRFVNNWSRLKPCWKTKYEREPRVHHTSMTSVMLRGNTNGQDEFTIILIHAILIHAILTHAILILAMTLDMQLSEPI